MSGYTAPDLHALDADAMDDDEMEVEVVVLDLAGTTIRDDGLVERAFELAAIRTGLADGDALEEALEYVRDTMGQSKIDVFRALADSEEDAQRANEAFEAAYAELIEDEGVEEIPGAAEAIRALKDAGIAVVLTTGFSPDTRDALLETLGWTDLADAALSPADAGRGRPYPDLPLTALLRVEGSSVQQLVVVGDTVSDIESGVNAGAGLVVGVLTGAHDQDELEDAGADAIIRSIADLPALLGVDAE